MSRNPDLQRMTAQQLHEKGLVAHHLKDHATLMACLAELEAERTTAAAASCAANLRCLVEAETASPPAEWLAKAEGISRLFSSKDEGHYSVYVVLLRNEEGKYGFYIGMTSLTVEERFQRHKDGVQAGKRRVTKYGVKLQLSMCSQLDSMSYEESLRIESELAAALKRADYWVEGGH